MNEENLTNLLLIAFMVEVVWAAREFYRVLSIYREEHGWENLLFRVVVVLCGVSVLVGILFLPIAVAALFDLPSLPFTGVELTVGVMVLLGAVIVYGRVFQRIRNRGATVRREDHASDS